MTNWNTNLDTLNYWKCEQCGIFKTVDSLREARLAAEAHEKAEHGKKQVAVFGVEKFNFELGID